MYSEIIQRYTQGKSNTKILIIGGIHGDEISGIQAIQLFIKQIFEGIILLQNCTIDLIPIANMLAYDAGERFIEYNLNRLFSDEILYYDGDNYEKNRAKSIAELMKNEKYNYVLDLHSTSNPSYPFLFCEEQNISHFQNLGIPYIVSGRSTLNDSAVSGDTESYANRIGSVACTFEAGTHLDPLGTEYAYMFITNFLKSKGYINDRNNNLKHFNNTTKNIAIQSSYICKNGKINYNVEPRNFLPIRKNECIGFDGNLPIYSGYDGYLIMPKKSELIRTGIECFFIGT